MNVTGNMGLTIWDLLTDDFDYGQLEDNWIAVDVHDHSPGRGVPIGTAGIQNQAITQSKLGLQSVGQANIQNFAVGDPQIQEASITGDKIAPGSLTGSDLANGTVSWTQLDPTLFPLGYIGLWYRPPGSGASPGGVWEVMDGRSWSTINNIMGSGQTKLTTGVIPNMLGSFAMGTGLTTGVGIGNTGGASTIDLYHAHSVGLPAMSVPPHTHPIASDGLHNHTFAGGFHMATRQNTIPPGRTLNLIGPNNSVIPVSDFTVFANGLESGLEALLAAGEALTGITTFPVEMDLNGYHDHTGNTGASATGATGTSVTTTDVELSATQSVVNPYVGLCYIMKVRNS